MAEGKSYSTFDYYDSYKKYIGDNPAYKVNRKQFRSILKDYFQFLASEMIDRSKEVRLPGRLGSVTVIKRKPKKFDSESLRIDFRASRELKKAVFHLNEHSDGYNYRFYWYKKDILIENSKMYELVMSRANKRRLAYMIKTEHKDYIEKIQ